MYHLGTRAIHWWVLGCFLFGILVFKLGSRGLNEPDEGRYANIALEALESDHPWWEPQLADVGHYDKPPLTYWVSALGYKIFGLNEWGARLPSLAGAILTLAGLGWAAYRRYGPVIAWRAILIAGTLLQVWLWARILSCDMLFTGWCTLAIAAWVETRFRGGKLAWWTLQVLFWTLAGWTKATPTLVPLVGLTFFVFSVGDAEDRRALRLPLLLPLVVLLSSIWYGIVLGEHPALTNFFFHRELAQRISGHIAGRSGPIYYYIPLCLLVWLPWWPLAAVALIRQRANFRLAMYRWKDHVTPGVCLVLAGFCIFSLIGSKHPTYLLPFAPWAALEISLILNRDDLLRRSAIILPVAGLATLVYLIAISVVPARESRMGMHSSLRDVAELLRRHHATVVYSDHFWPSLQLYYGEEVHYTGAAPEETYDPADEPDEHFGFDDSKPQAGGWFIHFRKADDPAFARWLDDPNVPKTKIGDFLVGPMMAAAPGSSRTLLLTDAKSRVSGKPGWNAAVPTLR
jgi:4-amino-4-deoxy-L-arabinose transferase-like glycosyltransferase